MVIVSEAVLCNRANKIEKRSLRAVENGHGNARRMPRDEGERGPSRENQWAMGKYQRCGQLRTGIQPKFTLSSLLPMRQWSLIYRAYR